jgi:hypothetical protein
MRYGARTQAYGGAVFVGKRALFTTDHATFKENTDGVRHALHRCISHVPAWRL